MSIHFILGLSFSSTDEEIEKAYIKYLIKNHPDRSKKDTAEKYHKIRREYEKYKMNITDEYFFASCTESEVRNMICRCGSVYDNSNVVFNKIECNTCSCYIIVNNDSTPII